MTEFTDWKRIHYGLVLGRFQPLHLGHIEYLSAARDKSDHLVVGVTNPNTNVLVHDNADPKRSLTENNPFSYFDRQQMISASLAECGWGFREFSIVPASINSPEDMTPYLPPPPRTTVYITVYDRWGERKADLIRSLGYPVEVMWRRRMEDRLTSGTKLREAMRAGGGSWRELVPQAVSRYLDDNGWTGTIRDPTAPASVKPASPVDEHPATYGTVTFVKPPLQPAPQQVPDGPKGDTK